MRRGAVYSLVLVVATACGCRWDGAGPTRLATDGPVWHPRPAAVRVYPSTRFVVQGDQALLEARIELADEMGDTLKASGEFRLELYHDDSNRRLYAWRVPAVTLDDQRAYYDPITRSYLLRLKLDAAAIADVTPRLRVVFTSVEGERLRADAVVRN